ncbi:anticodon-binding protein [Xylaria sp. CBS 124048]|nr:anticodon-binding protein [Xylaria sp. CBS 124048]
MIRKNARARRDFLYRKAILLQNAEVSERRSKLRAALASGRPLDPNIANDKALRKDFQYDESTADRTLQDELELDDEYQHLSGLVDPRVLITTSRDPSTRLQAKKSGYYSRRAYEYVIILGFFVLLCRIERRQRLARASLVLQYMQNQLTIGLKLNRGGTILPDLVKSAQSAGLSDVMLLHEHRGQPTGLTISHLPFGPTVSFSLHNVVLRHDIPNTIRGTVSESYPHLIFEGFSTPLGKRIVKVLQHIFPPREAPTSKSLGSRVITFKNIDDTIEVRHHVFVQTGYDSVELSEVGPRMSMKPFQIRAGLLDQRDGDVEWALTNYTRTSRKKNYL